MRVAAEPILVDVHDSFSDLALGPVFCLCVPDFVTPILKKKNETLGETTKKCVGGAVE